MSFFNSHQFTSTCVSRSGMKDMSFIMAELILLCKLICFFGHCAKRRFNYVHAQSAMQTNFSLSRMNQFNANNCESLQKGNSPQRK